MSDSSEVEVELSSSDSETRGLEPEERLRRMVERMVARSGLKERLERETAGVLEEVRGRLAVVRSSLEQERGGQEGDCDTLTEHSEERTEVEEEHESQVDMEQEVPCLGMVPHGSVEVGTRVLALLTSGIWKEGTVAEPPKLLNGERYLLFLDDDSPAYVKQEQLRLVVEEAEGAGQELLSGETKKFLDDYLACYPERKMVRMAVGQPLQVERRGKWRSTKVVAVDASLAKVRFGDGSFEWLYRGSPRLKPLWSSSNPLGKKEVKMEPGTESLRSRKHGNMPSVELVTSEPRMKPQVAKKSSKARKPAYKSSLSLPTADSEVIAVPWAPPASQVYTPQLCSSTCCINAPAKPLCSPLMVPLHYGWLRRFHRQETLTNVFYVSPCGLSLRSVEEVVLHLQHTKQNIAIDCFSFSPAVRVAVEWRTEQDSVVVEDISHGAESVPVAAVNTEDQARPEFLDYCTTRIPQGGVKINTDPEFLVCCDCQDNCSDSERCACRQLTSQSTRGDFDGEVEQRAGYDHRRLLNQVVTGIYECNSRCRCSSLCHNRVAQQPLSCPLQLLRTKAKGWGLRTLADLPAGTFVCTYVGNVYSPEEGDVMGSTFGDEYFASLDLIEVIEKRKEGYESDVSDLTSDDDSSNSSNSVSNQIEEKQEAMGLRRSSRLQSNFKGGLTSHKEPKECGAKRKKAASVRELFGDVKEEPYIMDARVKGNVGKYFNHSCEPNIFPQNVFVDSHDLRFPWLAFFTCRLVTAGEELAWDYNYEVGAVPGKRIDCHCGAGECRKRLL